MSGVGSPTQKRGLLARSQYSEGPATGHLDTCFSRFPCVYKQTLRRFPTFQVATICFSYIPPGLNLLVTNFIFYIPLARNQYSEGPATGHLDTGFCRFPCAYKQTLRRFPTFQVATTCFSCTPPDLNSLVVTDFMFCLHVI